MRHEIDSADGRDFDAEFDEIIAGLIADEPEGELSLTDRVRALFANLAVDAGANRPVSLWCLLWGFELDDEQVALLDMLIDGGWRFTCDYHEGHDFDVSLTRRFITIADFEGYGEADVRRLALALEELVEGEVSVFPAGFPV